MASTLGTATFVKPNGYTLAVDIEIQDSVGEMAKFDSGAGAATGADYYEHPESLRLVSLSLANVTTAVGIRVVVNGTPTSQVIRHNLNNVCTIVASVTGVVPLNIGFAPGSKIQLIGV